MLLWTCPKSLADTLRSQTWDKLTVWEKGKNLTEAEGPNLTEEERQMLEQMKLLPKGNSAHVIYQVNGRYYGFNNCSLEGFEWDGAAWQSITGPSMTGTSCSNYFFYREGQLYSFGGVGYWQNHSDLMQFSEDGRIEFVQTQNQPQNFYGSLTYQTQDGLFSLFGGIWNLREGHEEIIWGGYFLDLESKVWKSVSFDLNQNFKEKFGAATFQKGWAMGGAFETADYAGIEIGTPILKSGWLIFDKKTGQLYLKEFTQSFLVSTLLKWFQVKGNTITVFPEYDLTPIEFDVEKIVATAIPVGRVEVGDRLPSSEEEPIQIEYTHMLLFLLNLLVILGIAWTIYFQNKKSDPELQPLVKSTSEITAWAKKLEPFQGTIISQETMDELLGIQGQKNPDIRK